MLIPSIQSFGVAQRKGSVEYDDSFLKTPEKILNYAMSSGDDAVKNRKNLLINVELIKTYSCNILQLHITH